MSELGAFAGLGFHHITDPGALDHLLFLFALAAIYHGMEWRKLLWVVSAFTVGHSLTLALAVTGWLPIPASLIEFLIPITIVATGAENLVVRYNHSGRLHRRYRPVFAGVFGLVHGAGFANYLKSLFTGSIAAPLLGFNLGIELGQIAVLAVAAVILAGIDRLLGYRLRVAMVSVAVVIVAATMVIERIPR